ncbi:hypothetical protein BY458DRAFT_503580 [Sporodiniella umbellata]|nr:hypothetical protein BY458DRAFT_503580 [Sporodiniella umbellata]
MSYQIVLREGITGGFVGPVIKQAVEIKGDHTGASVMHSTLKPDSKADYNTLAGDAPAKDITQLVELLRGQLSELPTEKPIGSQDIYGQDISLTFLSEDFQWSNGGPEGCSQGESSVQATQEQKDRFKELVSLVKGTGQQFAVSSQ